MKEITSLRGAPLLTYTDQWDSFIGAILVLVLWSFLTYSVVFFQIFIPQKKQQMFQRAIRQSVSFDNVPSIILKKNLFIKEDIFQ